MNIQIVRKKAPVKSVTLLFKKQNIRSQHGGKVPVVYIYDEKGEYLPVSVKLTHIQTNVPSTLLSRWINANFADKLLTLVDRCYTVEKVKDGVRGRWFFTNLEGSVYGLHKLSVTEVVAGQNTKFTVVRVDDSIGMKSVEHILNILGMSIKCDFLVGKDRMEKIQVDLGGGL